MEKFLHSAFNSVRLRGEWFKKMDLGAIVYAIDVFEKLNCVIEGPLITNDVLTETEREDSAECPMFSKKKQWKKFAQR